MVFVITRASAHCRDRKPCEGAVKRKLTSKQFGRDWKREAWTVEFNTLEELDKFMDEVGAIVIEPVSYNFVDIGEITIYDDYIE